MTAGDKDFLLDYCGIDNFSQYKRFSEYTTEDFLWVLAELDDNYFDDIITVFAHTRTISYGKQYEGKIIINGENFMNKIIELNSEEFASKNKENQIIEVTGKLLSDVRNDLKNNDILNIPIEQLATLGVGVSSLIPAFRTVTQDATFNTQGLYRLANQSVGDTLKLAQDGNFWGAFKTVGGKSKFAKLQSAGPITATTKTVYAINPATIMMSFALFSIEQKLADIEKMQRQILSFLEIEKEAEIEADVETLSNIMYKYKSNWENEYFVASNHKLVLDIQRTARKNMNAYRKKVSEIINSKKFIVMKNIIDSTLNDLQKKFKYYRLSLYVFSMSSMLEIMLSGNFKEEHIKDNKNDIERFSSMYIDLFEKSSYYLEKISGYSVGSNVFKGIGTASKSIGKFVGSIPLIKESAIDELLQDRGEQMRYSAENIEKRAIHDFAKLSNPETRVFIDKMDDMIKIYNHTENIYFDDKKVYLIMK